MVSADDLRRSAEHSSAPAGCWADLMLAMVAALQPHTALLPPDGAAAFDVAESYWRGDESRRDDLPSARFECWAHLDAKHGSSTAISDDEDRLLRALLCVLDPDVRDDEDASLLAEWFATMINEVER